MPSSPKPNTERQRDLFPYPHRSPPVQPIETFNELRNTSESQSQAPQIYSAQSPQQLNAPSSPNHPKKLDPPCYLPTKAGTDCSSNQPARLARTIRGCSCGEAPSADLIAKPNNDTRMTARGVAVKRMCGSTTPASSDEAKSHLLNLHLTRLPDSGAPMAGPAPEPRSRGLGSARPAVVRLVSLLTSRQSRPVQRPYPNGLEPPTAWAMAL